MTIIHPGVPHLERIVRPFQGDDIFVRNPRIVRLPADTIKLIRITTDGDLRITTDGDLRILPESAVAGADVVFVWGKPGTFVAAEEQKSGVALDADVEEPPPTPGDVTVNADWLQVDARTWGSGLNFFIPPLEEREKTRRILEAEAQDARIDSNEGIENVHFNLRLKPDPDAPPF